MANRLATETSPYLLQHAQNPVEWYPWGPEALRRAKAENKPIFLSIGYSACHWCHVMEHESFEDQAIARVMNEHFVNIKVDREERPDLDQIYMNAVQMLTGRGGWPMSVFLTPDLKPFYGGTYWPPASRMGMPGFLEVLSAVREAWNNKRDQIATHADGLTEQIQGLTRLQASGPLSVDLLRQAAAQLERNFDPRYGGFGGAPKFPHPMDLQVLLRLWFRERNPRYLEIVTTTLDKMAAGGIYDQLGGGFHRYSVDERWLVPHFEKMLYDNALLTTAYVEGYLVTGNAEYARVARETIEYVLRDMTSPDGGFYSTEDADSEGEEGKFYVWTPSEIEQILGPEAATTFLYVYDVSEPGNFEGQSILNLPKSISQAAQIRRREEGDLRAELAQSRAKLLEARNRRVRPGRDDKVLVSWNGLMIDALAQASGALSEPKYLQAAQRASDFVLTHMRRDNGRLLHSWRNGQARVDGFLEDYACFTKALVSVYEAGFGERYLVAAVQLADLMCDLFVDTENGGFFSTASDHESLIMRPKDLHDSSVPSANSMATMALLRLTKLTGQQRFNEIAERSLISVGVLVAKLPTAMGQMLLALDFYLGPTPQIAVLGDTKEANTARVLKELWQRFIPNKAVACRETPVDPSDSQSPLAPLFAGKQPGEPPPTIFVCEKFTCQTPVNGPDAAIEAWRKLARQ